MEFEIFEILEISSMEINIKIEDGPDGDVDITHYLPPNGIGPPPSGSDPCTSASSVFDLCANGNATGELLRV